MHRNDRIPGSILVLLFLLNACGGGGKEQPATGDSKPPARVESSSIQTSRDIDPCSLVTRAEAEQALGGTVNEAERPPEANMAPRLVTCRYVAQIGQRVAVMTVMVRTGSSASESRLGFQSAKEPFADAQTVPGVGDDAFWILDQLHILQGNVYLIIGGDFDVERAKALAQTALERLR